MTGQKTVKYARSVVKQERNHTIGLRIVKNVPNAERLEKINMTGKVANVQSVEKFVMNNTTGKDVNVQSVAKHVMNNTIGL
jgi:hypothetical protein